MTAEDLPMLGDEDVEDAAHVIPPADDQLKRIASLGQEVLRLRQVLAEQGEILAGLQAQLRDVEEVQLPEALTDAGVSAFTLTSGEKVELKTTTVASIPGDRQEEAFQWLELNGHGDLIKRQVVVAFGRGEGERADALVQKLLETFPDQPLTDKRSVHGQTLSAFVREQKAQGVTLPDDLLGVFTRRFADVFTPKVPTRRKKS